MFAYLRRPAVREAIEGYIGISPWLIGFIIFTAGPMIASMALSLTNWRIAVTRTYMPLGGPAAAARAAPSRKPSRLASMTSSSVRPFVVESSGA